MQVAVAAGLLCVLEGPIERLNVEYSSVGRPAVSAHGSGSIRPLGEQCAYPGLWLARSLPTSLKRKADACLQCATPFHFQRLRLSSSSTPESLVTATWVEVRESRLNKVIRWKWLCQPVGTHLPSLPR